MNVNTAIDLYLLDCQLRRLKPRTIEHYTLCLHFFCNHCEQLNILDISSINSSVLQQYQQRYQQHSAQYQKNLLVAVTIFLKYCQVEGYIDSVPRIRLPKVRNRVKKAFTKNEVARLLKACSRPTHKLILMLMLDTGIRLNELRTIDVKDADLHQGLLHIVSGKTGERFVPIGVTVRKELIKYLDGRKDGPLIVSQWGNRYTKNGLVKLFKTLRSKTGIAHCSSHTCRRTFATEMMRQKVSVHVLAKMMGHSDIQTLKQYLDITKDDMLSVQAEFSMIDNL